MYEPKYTKLAAIVIILVVSFITLRAAFTDTKAPETIIKEGAILSKSDKRNEVVKSGLESGLLRATFAGGCFWCMEPPFEKLKGVVSVISGYTGGSEENPTYEEVSYGQTGHIEAIEVSYDPTIISYSLLLDVFWMQIDPTDQGGQFADRGKQYTTAIFYHGDEQKRLAEKSKEELGNTDRFDKPIVTKIVEASVFYPAEEYHQDFYKKSPVRYKSYRFLSGRDRFLKNTWEK